MKLKIGDSSDFIKKSVGTKVLHHQNQVSLKDLENHGLPVVLLVDGDIPAYRCSATCDGRLYKITNEEKVIQWEGPYKKDATEYCKKHSIDTKEIQVVYTPEPEDNAKRNVKKFMRELRKDLKAHKMEVYLTPEVLFRKDYMEDYKANRKNVRKPTHLKVAKDYLTEEYHAEMVEGYEADDLLAIRAKQIIKEGKYTPIICTVDKDLDTVSCYHYNWTKKCIYFVTPEEATLFFYKQVLMGDKTDNIPGLHGIGPKKAEKILENLDGSSSFECYKRVLDAYLSGTEAEEGETKEAHVERVVRELTRNARLLYILHELGEVWQPPVKLE